MRKVVKHAWVKIVAGLALFTVELAVIVAMFVTCIIVFLWLAGEIQEGQKVSWDDTAFAFWDELANPRLMGFMVFMSFLGSAKFITGAAIALIIYFLFIKKHRWYSLKVPVIAIGSISLNLITKFFFHRERPVIPHLVEASGLSFPSGHSMVSASFYGLMIYLVWHNIHKIWLRNLLIVLLTLIILFIGSSRVYLHVHYATDVAAGFSAGFLWVILAVYGLRRLEQYSRRNLAPAVEEAATTVE